MNLAAPCRCRFRLWKSKSFKHVRQFSSASLRLCPIRPATSNISTLSGRLGQPTPWTHEHLMEVGEVTPGIQASEYSERRSKLVQEVVRELSSLGREKGIVVVPGGMKKYISDKIPYVFRQDSDMLYLTGCQEPESIFMLEVDGRSGGHDSKLFVSQEEELKERWEGKRTGLDKAKQFFGVDSSHSVEDFRSVFSSKIKNYNERSVAVWYELSNSPLHPKGVRDALCDFKPGGKSLFFQSTSFLIHRLRAIKSEAELKLLRNACNISCEAVMETMKFTQSGLSEAQLWAKVDYECRMRGAPFLSYPPVVASSEAAEVIHYITNDRLISKGDLVLMDTGCEYFGYTSDITRCWPVSGKFSTLQRDLYQTLLGIHEALLQYAETGVSLNQLYSRMCQLIGQEMKHLGALVEKDPTNAELERIVRELCPHHVSHYLGMDVHDTPSISRAKPTEQGMVFTVEPGIYIRRGNPSIKGEFWGIGLRVEDDVAVTESGLEVLTNSCPREAECIETICNSVPTF